jgi:hypothetical protein
MPINWAKPLKRLLIAALNGPGSLTLRPYEDRIISCARQTLPQRERNILDAQLANIQLIQRWHPGRLHRIFIDESACHPFENTAEEFCL